jgi:hypothetical protein
VADEFGGDQEQLAELDFEGQAAAAPEGGPTATPEPQAEPVPTGAEGELEEEDDWAYDDAYRLEGEDAQALAELAATGQLTEEDLREWAEVDPGSYADFMTQVQVGQYIEELEARLQPELQAIHQQTAVSEIDAIKAAVGEDVFEAHKETVAGIVGAESGAFLNPETRLPNVIRAFRAAEFEQAQAARQEYLSGSDIKSDIDAAAGMRDAFGNRRVVSSEDGRVSLEVPSHMTEQQAQAAVEKKARSIGSVHIEGGSGPQPQFRDESLDPVVAEIEEHRSHKDAFGRMPFRG